MRLILTAFLRQEDLLLKIMNDSFQINNGEAKKPRKNFTSQTHHHGMAIQSVCLKLTRDCS